MTREPLERLFHSLNDDRLSYVVARKYETLPAVPADGDVDIYVAADEFETLLDSCERAEFENSAASTASDSLALLDRAVRRPVTATTMLLQSPQTVFRLVRGDTMHRQNYQNRKLFCDGIMLDISNHLAYTSPMDETRIRVDPSIEQRMLDRRRRHNGFYVPAPVDELAHIVPHCVFDKQGDFSDYYVDRCDSLVQQLMSDGNSSELRQLFSDLFYEAGDLVYDLVLSGEYSVIRSRLRSFDEY